ncbi:MAG: phage tail sheath subtilisin-like domain-containing protein [Pyrinomonadaceae bacterium]
MPEYLAPGVYVEEVSFRSKSIEGVSTTTTGFIGPTRYGPDKLEPDIVTSLGEFERIYGDRQPLEFTDSSDNSRQKIDNFMWHAVRAFFEEGGKRLYISRVFNQINSDSNDPKFDDGRAKAFVTSAVSPPATVDDTVKHLKVSARFPGVSGTMRVWLTLRIGQSVLGSKEVEQPDGTKTQVSTVAALLDKDIVCIGREKEIIVSPVTSPPSLLSPPLISPPQPPVQSIKKKVMDGKFYQALMERDSQTGAVKWTFKPLKSGDSSVTLADLDSNSDDQIRIVNLSAATQPINDEEQAPVAVWSDLALDPDHKRAGAPDSVFGKFAEKPANAADARRLPVVITANLLNNGLQVLGHLFAAENKLEENLLNLESTDTDRSIRLKLDDGNDGQRPTAGDYEGVDKETLPFKTGLKAFEDIEDISIVAAPGSTFGYGGNYRKNSETITNLLISHAERMRYRIAVLDSGNDQTIADVRAMRARIDSKYAAFYYPWVRILDPVTQQETYMPPSGFVAGIYARNDVERAVYKAPANEVVRLSIGFEKTLNKAQQEVLNPEGINCFRFFEGRGFRLWGARTTSSDPEWKYVNLRRYFAYLERSIDRGTQWAVFEPNSEALWTNVRLTIQDFLYNEWVSGALLGDKPEKAYFVRCDRSTMTQNDLDNGRLICLIGVAAVKPAEFVILRIGQWTADRKV